MYPQLNIPWSTQWHLSCAVRLIALSHTHECILNGLQLNWIFKTQTLQSVAGPTTTATTTMTWKHLWPRAKQRLGPNTKMAQKSQVDFECKWCKWSLFRQRAAVFATLAVSATKELLQLWLYCGKYLLAVTLAGYYFSSALVVALAFPNWICNVLFLFFKTILQICSAQMHKYGKKGFQVEFE